MRIIGCAQASHAIGLFECRAERRGQLRRGDGPADAEALDSVTAVAPQVGKLPVRFHALRDHAQMKDVRQLQDRVERAVRLRTISVSRRAISAGWIVTLRTASAISAPIGP